MLQRAIKPTKLFAPQIPQQQKRYSPCRTYTPEEIYAEEAHEMTKNFCSAMTILIKLRDKKPLTDGDSSTLAKLIDVFKRHRHEDIAAERKHYEDILHRSTKALAESTKDAYIITTLMERYKNEAAKARLSLANLENAETDDEKLLDRQNSITESAPPPLPAIEFDDEWDDD